MKTILLLTSLIFSTTTFADSRCDFTFPNSKVCAELNWLYGPYFDQENSFRISLTNSTQYNAIKVIPWMVMHGHEHGSGPVKMKTIGQNEFQIDNAHFLGGMMGDWFIRLQLLNGIQVVEEARLKVEPK
jgi:hypothetical protein